MFSKGYSILYSINISFVLMSDLGQAQCQALFGVEILNFFFFSYVTIHWFIYIDSCCTAKAAWSHVSSATDHGAVSSFLLNDQGATCLISSQPTAQFLGFANNASFVENNEYCFIFPSLLTMWIISFKFAFLEIFLIDVEIILNSLVLLTVKGTEQSLWFIAEHWNNWPDTVVKNT